MKRIAVFAIVVLLGCTPVVTFDAVSCPYLDEYGEPDRVMSTGYDGKIVVTWMWEDVLVVQFGWDTADIVENWIVIREVWLGDSS